MSCRLRTYNTVPPGGFPFEEVGPKPRKFRSEPVITAIAQQVASYRQANGLPRATVSEALVDVDRFQCARLGNDKRYCTCVDGDPNAVALSPTHPIVSGGCKGCGARV